MPIVLTRPDGGRLEITESNGKFSTSVYRPDGTFFRRQESSREAVQTAVSNAAASGVKVTGTTGGIGAGPSPRAGAGGGGGGGAGR
jgi:hypothetical protein